MAEVQATHTETQFVAIKGKQPKSLKARRKLAETEDIETLKKVLESDEAHEYDKVTARQRLTELDADLEPEEEQTGVQYPIEKGNGFWELSDGSTIQGEETDAIVAEKKLQGAEEATDESSDYNYDEGVFELIEAKYKDGGIEAVEAFTEGDERKQVNELVEELRAKAEEEEA